MSRIVVVGGRCAIQSRRDSNFALDFRTPANPWVRSSDHVTRISDSQKPHPSSTFTIDCSCECSALWKRCSSSIVSRSHVKKTLCPLSLLQLITLSKISLTARPLHILFPPSYKHTNLHHGPLTSCSIPPLQAESKAQRTCCTYNQPNSNRVSNQISRRIVGVVCYQRYPSIESIRDGISRPEDELSHETIPCTDLVYHRL